MPSRLQRSRQVATESGYLTLLGKAVKEIGDAIEMQGRNAKKRRIVENYRDSPRYLNVGGGSFLRDHWRVLDYHSDWYDYPEALVDYSVNLEHRDEWPIETESFDLVYSSATLEHLSDETVRHTLRESNRILREGGGIHLTLPDVDVALRHYVNRNTEWMREIRGVSGGSPRNRPIPDGYEPEYFLLRWIATPLILKGYADVDLTAVREDWGDLEKPEFLDGYTGMVKDEWQEENPGGHRNWFNYNRLESLLSEAGFSNIERVPARQSRFTELCHRGFDPRPQWSVHVDAEV